MLNSFGAAEKLWLHYSLQDLEKSLAVKLQYLSSRQELEKLISDTQVETLIYGSNADPRVVFDFQNMIIEAKEIQANNIFNFDAIKNKSGNVFKVFTPFYKHCLSLREDYYDKEIKNHLSSKIEEHLNFVDIKTNSSLTDYNLLGPKAKWNQAWQAKVLEHWDISEQKARAIIDDFSQGAVGEYNDRRDFPGHPGTSKISPYLHFGMISPFRIWCDLDTEGNQPFLRQLCWREFAQYILHHFPYTFETNMNDKFDRFPWKNDTETLKLWQQGQTGYPIVDAGMRELWETGWMHNRVRMIVGSFLVKDLMIPWQQGAKWFEDTLFDADLPNNSMGWQWVAGSGVDASPYFRIFNPMTQSEKFDAEANYIRKWVPEIAQLDNKWIHRPFEAPDLVLEAAGVKLGETYPEPVVNHDAARKEALARFKELATN